MNATQLNLACASFQNVNKMSLHDDNPGPTGANELDYAGYAQATLSWTSPSGGMMSAAGVFEDFQGAVKFVGLWDDSVFVDALPFVATAAAPTDLTVAVEHSVVVRP